MRLIGRLIAATLAVAAVVVGVMSVSGRGLLAWLYCCWWRHQLATRSRGTSISVVEKRSHGKARTHARPGFLTSWERRNIPALILL